MPRRRAARRKAPRRRKRTYKKRRRSLYRGRRTQTPTKSLFLASRFRKMYFSMSLPQFTVTPPTNSGGLCKPIRFAIDNIYDPLSRGFTVNPNDFTVLDDAFSPGYVYGPTRGHDALSLLFREYKVHGLHVTAKFQNAEAKTAVDIGMKCSLWSQFPGISSHSAPVTYYDYLERYGPITTINTINKTLPIVSTYYGKQGTMQQQIINAPDATYNRLFTEPRFETNVTDEVYLHFYSPHESQITGNLEIQLCFMTECLSPSSKDDQPFTPPQTMF